MPHLDPVVNRQLTFHLIPHTHWDREWYLPRAAFQARLVPAVDAMLDLLDNEPDARFVCDGQTILMEDAVAVMPELAPRIQASVMRGQCEVGPWYVLADEIIPSAESLVRNLMRGSTDAATIGARMDVCYSPDAFGHPAMLPAIAAQFGIGWGVIWRGLAPDERGDIDLRIWRGADGSEMLTYHLPPQGYEIGAALTADDSSSAEWHRIRDGLVSRAATAHVAVFIGADHHAPPAAIGVIRDRIASAERDHVVRVSSLREYFTAVDRQRGALGAIEGELRTGGHTWVLQGVHGTRCRMKRAHALVERSLLRDVEPMVALAGWARQHGRDHRAAIVAHAWRTLLQCQFHDTLAGTVADDVAREQSVRLAAVASLAEEVRRNALDALVQHDADRARRAGAHRVPTLVLWNPVPRWRGGIVTCDITAFRRDVLVGPPDHREPRTALAPHPFGLKASDGSVIPVQVLARETGLERIDASRHYPDLDEVERFRIAFDASALAGFGFEALTLATLHDVPHDRGLRTNGNGLTNAFVTVTATPTGSITIVDHRTGEVYEHVMALEDECDCGDTYTPHMRRGGHAASTTPLSLSVDAGPLVGTITVGWRIESAGAGDLLCHVHAVLHADSPVLRLRYSIDNCATNHRLRARLPIGAGERAIAGAAFAAEVRPPVPASHGVGGEPPASTAPAHRFVAAGAGARGLVVMQPGFFEYEWTAAADLHVTLIRSIGELSIGDLPTRPGHAGWPTPTPEAQEQGWHHFDVAVAPVETGDLTRPDLLERIWAEAFAPINATFIRDFVGNVSIAEEIEVTLRGEGLVFSTLKAAEDGVGMIVRCYNVTDRVVAGELAVSLAIGAATLVQLDESSAGPLVVGPDGLVCFSAPPRSIVSIRLSPHQ